MNDQNSPSPSDPASFLRSLQKGNDVNDVIEQDDERQTQLDPWVQPVMGVLVALVPPSLASWAISDEVSSQTTVAGVFMATLTLSAAFAGVVIIVFRHQEGLLSDEWARGLTLWAFVASTLLASFTGYGALDAAPMTSPFVGRGVPFILEVIWLGIKTFGIVGVLMAALSGAWFGWRVERIIAVFRTTA